MVLIIFQPPLIVPNAIARKDTKGTQGNAVQSSQIYQLKALQHIGPVKCLHDNKLLQLQ
jgi:hypothetical protein